MQNNYDVIIIGGGAAGMMSAISAKRNNPKLTIAIIDRTFALGRKILVCGAGRCNITNIHLNENPESHYYGASKEFITSILSQFGYKDIVNFFEDLGIGLYTERKTNIGKVFPVTDQAKTVTSLLEDEINRLKIDVYLNTEVVDVKAEGGFIVKTEGVEDRKFNKFESNFLILSAGGKTYPALGSNGTGYNIAQSLGHRIISTVPSALPVVASDKLIHFLQGQKLEVEVTSIIDGKEVKTRTDDVMFTEYGLSGPAILNVSREISIHMNREQKKNVQVKLSFLPGKDKPTALEMLNERWTKRPEQTIEKSLFGLFPNKFATAILKTISIDPETPVGKLGQNQKDTLANALTGYIIKVNGTRSWNEAEFTAGGIDTLEVNHSTLESKKVKNLFFCGEILDVDGDVGGFNLSWAWSSGFVAGRLNN